MQRSLRVSTDLHRDIGVTQMFWCLIFERLVAHKLALKTVRNILSERLQSLRPGAWRDNPR